MQGLTTFPEGGYSIVHDEVAGRSVMLVMDHAPLGLEPLSAHGHADALAIWLHVGGHPLFVDAGTYTYHAQPARREWLRTTAAHNTVEVAGESQSLTAGAFNWRHKARSWLVRGAGGCDWQIEGAHDGYRDRFGIVHHRTCRRVPGGIEIVDAFDGGSMDRQAEVHFLIHPSLEVGEEDGRIWIAKSGERLVQVVPQTDCRIRRDTGPFYSPRYNRMDFATRLTLVPTTPFRSHSTRIEIVPQG